MIRTSPYLSVLTMSDLNYSTKMVTIYSFYVVVSLYLVPTTKTWPNPIENRNYSALVLFFES